ncbi:MAG TPA: hypothetical protein VD996_09940 [Chitinophagaceae bacterium]|nr:hypothetical protein [Chitinophagaceae bacterium]
MMIRNFERSPAYLKGTISENGPGQTRIEIAVRPNSVFAILFLPFAIFGIYNFIRGFAPKGNPNDFYGGLFMLTVGLPGIIGMCRVTAGKLRSNFENYMNLEPNK